MEIGKADIRWTYVTKFFTLGVNIILLPLIMAYLSDTELGLWYVFASISQVVNLFDFGFTSTISRHMTYAWSGAEELQKNSVKICTLTKERNFPLMSQIIITCKFVYWIISLISLLLMCTVGTVYIYQVTGSKMSEGILFSWIIYVIAVFLNLLYGYWSSLLQGIGAVAERNKMAIYSKIIQIILAFVLLKNGMGLLGFVISYAISGITLRFFGKLYFQRKTFDLKLNYHYQIKDIKFCFSKIWATAWKDGIVMLAQYLSTQANTLICAYLIDLSTTSTYGIITQIGSIIGSFASAYYSAYQPRYSSLCLIGDKYQLKRLTCKCIFVYKGIFGIMSFGFFIVGIPLLLYIRPGMKIDIKMAFIVCLFYYLYNQHSLFCSMIASTNRVPYYKSFLITAIGSVGLSVLMTDLLYLGIWGLILAQIIVNLTYNNWYWPQFVMKEQKICYKEIYIIGFQQLKKEWLIKKL